MKEHGGENSLRLRRLGLSTHQEAVVFMRDDCAICRSEGFEAQARVRLRAGPASVVASLVVVETGHASPCMLGHGEAGLSDAAWRRLREPADGTTVHVSHAPPVESFSHVRAKLYGAALDDAQLLDIVRDIVDGRYADVQLASFVSACAGRLSIGEVVGLTRAMTETGERLRWAADLVMDKHCVGGLPGNRTTPLVVSIAAACGLTMPKTSSRAITSPAGTADTMETLAPVDLSLEDMRRVVEQEGGCIVWGGAVRLSPADDVLIRIEKALDVDSTGQLVASVLSKKVAAGSTHVLIDIPVGPTAKVRSTESADELQDILRAVAEANGLSLAVVRTDGRQPVGRGLGPALEATDVLKVLQNQPGAPEDLRQRAINLTGSLLEAAAVVASGSGSALAAQVLSSGKAWEKFQRICEAQGGMRTPTRAEHCSEVVANQPGVVRSVDNRRLARVAKLAGAPAAPAAGLEFLVPIGTAVENGQPLYIVHAETPGELAYALDYVESHPDIITVEEP